MSPGRRLRDLDWRTLVVALAATPVVVVSLRLVGFQRTQAWMTRWPPAPHGRRPLLRQMARDRARAVARAVGVAASHGPVRTSCLRRALLARWLLRREGIDVAIRIGVRPAAAGLCAHAWIEHEGSPVGDDPSVLASYAAFDEDFAAVAERAR